MHHAPIEEKVGKERKKGQEGKKMRWIAESSLALLSPDDDDG